MFKNVLHFYSQALQWETLFSLLEIGPNSLIDVSHFGGPGQN